MFNWFIFKLNIKIGITFRKIKLIQKVMPPFIKEENMVARTPDVSNLAEVLDRVLDKGIVVDAWARISLIGIEILTIEARVVIASVDTFLHYAEEITKIEQAAIGAPA